MWKDSLAAVFHRRTPSETPLIPRKPRPFSTATTLDPVTERETSEDQPPAAASQPAMPALDEKAAAPPETKMTDPAQHRDIESNAPSKMRSIRAFLMEDIDTAQAAAPLTAYCFMTGFIDAVCFTAIYVWCAFQTGNTVQLSLAVARLFNGQHDHTFHIADRQALCSLLSFIIGTFIGRVGDKIGPKTRMWLTLGTLIQTLFTMAGALTLWHSSSGSIGDSRGDPAWTDALTFVTIGFVSASMGLQGIMGKRLGTQFTTTVVLTTTWCELMNEPQLFNFRRLVIARDHKIMAILFLFIGGFTSRALLDKIGSPGTLGIGTGLRFVVMLWWLFVPAKKAKQ